MDDIGLVLQASFQIFAIFSVCGITITLASKKYLVYDVFIELKRIVDQSIQEFCSKSSFNPEIE